MSIRVLRAGGHHRMAWKNGAGTTAEIAVHPPHADLSTFGWRISAATVSRDGPFSVFPGVDRSMALLSGNGVRLEIERHGTVDLAIGGAPLFFPADVTTSARLVDGAVTVLNAMSRRGQFKHRLMLTVVGDLSRDACPDWRLVMAPRRLVLAAGGERFALATNDMVILEGAEASVSLSQEDPGPVLVIEIDRV